MLEIERRILFELAKLNSNVEELKRHIMRQDFSTETTEEIAELATGPVNEISMEYMDNFNRTAAQSYAVSIIDDRLIDILFFIEVVA